MKEFICHSGRKMSQDYEDHDEGFRILFDKIGNPIFECNVCGNRFNYNALKKRYEELNNN